MDRETGRPRGFAFVDYADLAAATEVIRQLNGQPFMGRTLSVSEARPREERGPRPPMGFPSSGFGPRPGGPPSGLGPGEVGGKRERNFGPPAPPKGKRTSQNKGRADAGPKGPIKVRGGGRVYDVDDPAVDAAAPVPFDDFATSLPDDEQATDAVKVADHDKLADELGDE